MSIIALEVADLTLNMQQCSRHEYLFTVVAMVFFILGIWIVIHAVYRLAIYIRALKRESAVLRSRLEYRDGQGPFRG